jgi:hypothetical protein
MDIRSTGEPLVAGGVVAAYRAAMLGREQWDYVRRAFSSPAVIGEQWFDSVGVDDWVDLPEYVGLLEAIEATIGTEELRGLTRRRVIDPMGSNFFSPMLRSWARSFGESPVHMLRGAVHVWRSAQRNTGSMRVQAISEKEVHIVIEGVVARTYRGSTALAASLEGLVLGFLDLAQPRPLFLEVELSAEADPLALICRFES